MAMPIIASSKALPTAPRFPADTTLDAAGLGRLLFKTTETIQTDFRRNPKRLPPAAIIPGTRQPIWLLSVVLAWLESQVVAISSPRRGRPTKREQLDRKAAQGAVAAAEGGAA